MKPDESVFSVRCAGILSQFLNRKIGEILYQLLSYVKRGRIFSDDIQTYWRHETRWGGILSQILNIRCAGILSQPLSSLIQPDRDRIFTGDIKAYSGGLVLPRHETRWGGILSQILNIRCAGILSQLLDRKRGEIHNQLLSTWTKRAYIDWWQ
jgi:hypothetical protein